MDRLPLYEKCKISIINYIVKNNLSIGDILPSQRTLCQMTGHSMITVRRALKDLEYEKMINSVHGKGSFIAKELKDTTVFKGNIILFDLLSDSYRGLSNKLKYLQRELKKYGYKLKIISVSSDQFPEFNAEVSMTSGIIASGIINDKWREFLSNTSVPTIIVGNNNEYIDNTITIGGDFKQDAILAIDYFCQNTSPKFAFLSPSCASYENTEYLVEGYTEGLAKHKISLDENLVFISPEFKHKQYVKDFLEKNHDKFDTLIIERGFLEHVVTCYFENDNWVKPKIGVIGTAWHELIGDPIDFSSPLNLNYEDEVVENLNTNANIIHFGRKVNYFLLAINIIFDCMLHPKNRKNYPKIIIIKSKILN